MKTKMVDVREGEDMGPIDWSHPMIVKMESRGRICATTPGMSLLDVLRDAEQNPGQWELTTDGGMPRCGFHAVIKVRMYDGGPIWKPTPAVLIHGMFGPTWEFFDMLSDARRVGDYSRSSIL